MLQQKIKQKIRIWLGLDEDHIRIAKVHQDVKDNNKYCDDITNMVTLEINNLLRKEITLSDGLVKRHDAIDKLFMALEKRLGALEKVLQEEYFKFRESDRKWKRNIDGILKDLQSVRRL